MIGSESLGPVRMVMVGGMTCEEWGQSFMLVNSGVGVEIRTGSTGLVEGVGHCLGVASNVKWTLLMVEKEAYLVANMTVFLCCKVWKKIQGGLGEGGPLGGMMAGVDEAAGVDEMLGVTSTVMVTTDTFMPTYPRRYFQSGTETQHI